MLQQQNSHKIIYLADDDEDDRMLFLDAIEELSLPILVNALEDGQQLLNTLYQTTVSLPEIIFLDINIPGKNGFECLEEIRNSESPFSAIKVIMLSTSRSDENINLCYELGADFYAVKPSTFQGLKKLLKDIMERDWHKAPVSKVEFLLAERR
jgi:CheY-like chemotaxis protein